MCAWLDDRKGRKHRDKKPRTHTDERNRKKVVANERFPGGNETMTLLT